MKNIWREHWSAEPGESERRLIQQGFTPGQACHLVDLKLRYDHGEFADDRPSTNGEQSRRPN